MWSNSAVKAPGSQTAPAMILVLAVSVLTGCSTMTIEQGDQAIVSAAMAEMQKRYQTALAAMAKGEYAKALTGLQTVAEAWPERAGPRFNLGVAFYHLGRDDEAKSSLQDAVGIDPELAAAYNLIGILDRRAGAFDASRKAYEQAIDTDPKYANAELNLAILYDIYLLQPKQALRHYDRFMALNGGEDDTVAQWVTDLKLRIKKQADKAADGRTP